MFCQLGCEVMLDTESELQTLVAAMRETTRQTHRMGFTATAQAMDELLRGLEKAQGRRQLEESASI